MNVTDSPFMPSINQLNFSFLQNYQSTQEGQQEQRKKTLSLEKEY